MRKLSRVGGMTCGFLVAVCATFAIADDMIPPGLKDSSDCMLHVLKATLGVTDAEIINDHGHFCLQYRAAEKSSWIEPNKFCLDGPAKSTGGRYDFTAMFPGLHIPGERVDIHISQAVVDKWTARCGVNAHELFE